MATKLKLVAAPTFGMDVGIPVAGGGIENIRFTFQFRTTPERLAWAETLAGKSNAAFFMSMVTAWELTDDFTADNVQTFLNNYGGALNVTFETYMQQLYPAKLGNSVR